MINKIIFLAIDILVIFWQAMFRRLWSCYKIRIIK